MIFRKAVPEKGDGMADGDGFQAEKAKEWQVEEGNRDAFAYDRRLVVALKVLHAGMAYSGVVPCGEPCGVVAAGVAFVFAWTGGILSGNVEIPVAAGE